MFIALVSELLLAPEERHVTESIALLTEHYSTFLLVYRHVAPTEQTNRQSAIGNWQ